MKKVAFHTLGCKLNFSETSTISRQFRAAGWSSVEFSQPADVYIINTCSVTENADRECRTIVNRAMAANQEAKIIIVGCYAQLKPQEIVAIPGVDLVLGATEKFNVLNFLSGLEKQELAQVMACEVSDANTFISAWSDSEERTRAFLKVQDGCDYNCSFCTIPLARGKSRSNTIDNVVMQAKDLVAAGIQEIVLTGVNLGDFGIIDGQDNHQYHFFDLAVALDQVEGLKRIRISSIEPNLLSKEVIELVAASEKWMPHFHIPLQSGSDEILGWMRRRYKSSLYADKVNLIKKLMPHASIGVDVIVGFPGETEEHFKETFNFLMDLPVSYFHVFTYSERNNTLAKAMMKVVPMNVRKERNKKLRSLSAKKLHDFTVKQIGNTYPVLFEHENNNGVMHGYTSNYIRVEYPYDENCINKVIDCELGDFSSSGLANAIPVLV